MAGFKLSLGALQIHFDGHRSPAVRRTSVATGEACAGPGAGWFESSWELVRGLEVREGLPGDAQLNEWIESCLRAAPAAAVSPC